MIFEEIKLYNFGIYQGLHSISLDSTDYKKPIILIGALNGAGKTTFLDALQLALYGKFAKCSNRGKLSYLAYLEKNINTYALEKKAFISLRFRHSENKENANIFEITREWFKEENKECKERIQVSLNGQYDPLISDNWEDFVSEFIPQAVSELFFFDGEKIENLANPKKSAILLKSGVEALLGLELLTKLSDDLNSLKRKKQEKNINNENQNHATQIKLKLEELGIKKNKILKEIKENEDELKEKEEAYSVFQEKFYAYGADKLDLKDKFENEKKQAELHSVMLKHELIKIISSALPLGLVEELLQVTQAQAIKEENANHYTIASTFLENQKNTILEIIKKHIKNKSLKDIEKEIEQNNINNDEEHTADHYLNVNPLYFNGLTETINSNKKIANSLSLELNLINEEIHLLDRKLNTIPSFDSVKELIAENVKSEEQLQHLKSISNDLAEELFSINNQITKLNTEYNTVLLRSNNEHFENRRQSQIIKHIDKLEHIITDFNQDLVRKNIFKLERKIKSKFDQLKRKESLVHKITIDPVHYSLNLFTKNMIEISSERLSAGERQLLSIAILWGLSDSSGKELPTIIDTPMGRLDGEHRKRLINNYFPNAAAQVILLSTDEEIYGSYYEEIKPYLANTYTIVFDEDKNTSHFVNGYFEDTNEY